MSETVFILGAGASRDSGAPLMRDFLQKARDLLKDGRVKDAEESFRLVDEACQRLRVAQSNAKLDIVNLEGVFAAVEMACLLGGLGEWQELEVERLRKAILDVIVRTLGETITFPIVQRERMGSLSVSGPYADFARLLRELWRKGGRNGVAPFSILTFNYDLCLEHALEHHGMRCCYCLPGQTQDQSNVNILKLHGSLNWRVCPQCESETVSYWDVGEFAAKTLFHPDQVEDRKARPYALARMLTSEHKWSCRHVSTGHYDPFLVPPTYTKSQFHSTISSVWRAAAAELSQAEQIYVIGFSLPETDQFFRDFYALGSMGDSFIQEFCVLDPDDSEDGVKRRFRELQGPYTADMFEHQPLHFKEAIAELRKRLLS